MSASILRLFYASLAVIALAWGHVVSANPDGYGANMLQSAEPSAIPIQSPTIPERTPREEQDRQKIIYFFSFDCAFCMRNDLFFWQWGLSLPNDVVFEPVPIIPTGDTYISMARAYYAAKTADPKRIAHFMAGAYPALQLANNNPNALETYLAIAQSAGIDPVAFEKAWNANTTAAALISARKRLTHYQPDTTPSLLLNGQYLISLI